jgi:hypothetical protein
LLNMHIIGRVLIAVTVTTSGYLNRSNCDEIMENAICAFTFSLEPISHKAHAFVSA